MRAFCAHQSRDDVRKLEDGVRRSAVFSMECGSFQKKLPVTLSACGHFAAVAACILVGNTVLVNCNAEAILFTNTRETNRS